MKPVLGITMGDPSGNGPEISIKCLMKPETYERCRPVVIGDAKCIEAALPTVEGAQNMKLHVIHDVQDAKFEYGTMDIYDLDVVDLSKRLYKKDRKKLAQTMTAEELETAYKESQIMCGDAAFQYVVKVIELAMNWEVDATVTNALNKDHINMAGHHYSGHTEIYAEYTHTPKYSMMLAHGELRVVHTSTHVSLKQAIELCKKERVLDVIHMADMGCRALGIENPRIAVAGLNPHCGENGMFGREEIEQIQPAIDQALAEGINIPDKAPTPADTVFSKALGGWYDIVVVHYHDQGHIPLKVLGFVYNKELQKWDAVAGSNVTLGLPIIRASVDHGTGEGHAGDGSANELSLMNAMDYAIRMALAKQKQE